MYTGMSASTCDLGDGLLTRQAHEEKYGINTFSQTRVRRRPMSPQGPTVKT